MATMHPVVFHIQEAELEYLGDLGLSLQQYSSWKRANLNDAGIGALVGFVLHNGEQQQAQLNPVEHIFLPPGERQRISLPKEEVLYAYFSFVFRSSVFKEALLGGTCDAPADCCRLAVFNLMPFCLSKQIVDKFICALHDCFAGLPNVNGRPRNVVFLSQNADWFLGSKEYARATGELQLQWVFRVVDIQGLVGLGTVLQNFRVPRPLFAETIGSDDRRLRRSLIYETNTYIGHFILPHSHVRTHYDLTQFVRRDDVFERVFGNIVDAFDGFDRVSIIATGIEKDALTSLCRRVSRELSSRLHTVAYISELDDNNRLVDVLRGSACIMILTDILNTGRSVEAVYLRLNAMNQRFGRAIRVLALAAMHNSPRRLPNMSNAEDMRTCVRIQRDYYEADAAQCLLCALGQPKREVRVAEDFRHVHQDQLTPYDFWEMVGDAKALTEYACNYSGRRLAYRVETKVIANRYGNWLFNVIRQKYYQRLPHREPDCIVTVKGEPGEVFAELVRRALLGAGSIVIHPVARNGLETATRSGIGGGMRSLEPYSRVLIVDDGINDGGTMRGLVLYCHAMGQEPIGAVVLDCRLDDQSLYKMKDVMRGAPLIYLYRWPVKAPEVR